MHIIRKMPLQLVTLFFIFLLTPFASIGFLGWPWEYTAYMSVDQAVLVALAYWLLPLGICVGFALRKFYVLPLLLVECLLLIGHTVLNADHQPLTLQLLRLGVLAVMAGLGFVAINKDVIYPLMSPTVRYWRRSARYPSSHLVHAGAKDSPTLPLNMQDCSLTGMGLSASQGKAKEFFAGKQAGDRFAIAIEVSQHRHVVEGEIAWKREVGANVHMGVRVGDKAVMGEVLKTLAMPVALPGPAKMTWADKVWENAFLKRTALTLWSASILVSFGMPACSRLGDEAGLAAKSAPAVSAPANADGGAAEEGPQPEVE